MDLREIGGGSGFFWLRIGTGGWAFVNAVMNLQVVMLQSQSVNWTIMIL
jgi:hypothetical protein